MRNRRWKAACHDSLSNQRTLGVLQVSFLLSTEVVAMQFSWLRNLHKQTLLRFISLCNEFLPSLDPGDGKLVRKPGMHENEQMFNIRSTKVNCQSK